MTKPLETPSELDELFDGLLSPHFSVRDLKTNVTRLLAEEVRKAELKSQLGMIEYYDQAPDNESCDWKGLLADNRQQIEYELKAHPTGKESN